jgi:hypothetical protein
MFSSSENKSEEGSNKPVSENTKESVQSNNRESKKIEINENKEDSKYEGPPLIDPKIPYYF